MDCSPVDLIGTMGVSCGLLTSGSDRSVAPGGAVTSALG